MSFGGGTTPTATELRDRYAGASVFGSVDDLDRSYYDRGKRARIGDDIYSFAGGEDGTWGVERSLPAGTFTGGAGHITAAGPALGIPGVLPPTTTAATPAATPAATGMGVGAREGYTPFGIYAVPPAYSGPYTAEGPGWDYSYPYIPRSMTLAPLGAGGSVRTITPTTPFSPGSTVTGTGTTGVGTGTTTTTTTPEGGGEGTGGEWVDPGYGWTAETIAAHAAAPGSAISWSPGGGEGGIVGRGVSALEGPEAGATIGIDGTMPGSGAAGSGLPAGTTMGFSPHSAAAAAGLATRPGTSVWGGGGSGLLGPSAVGSGFVSGHPADAAGSVSVSSPAEATAHAPGTDPSELASLGYSSSEISDIVEGRVAPAFGPKAAAAATHAATFGTSSPAVAAASAAASSWGESEHGISSADSAAEAGYGSHAEGEFGGTGGGGGSSGSGGDDGGDIDGGSR